MTEQSYEFDPCEGNEEANRIMAVGPSGADEAESFFINAVEACDTKLMRCALDVIEGTSAQIRTLQCLTRLTPDYNIRKAFRSFWDGYGWTIRMKIADDATLCDALRNLLESYKGPPVKLYRGEIAAQYNQGIYGISWTSDIEAARTFAEGLNCLPPDGGVQASLDGAVVAVLPLYLAKTRTWIMGEVEA